MRANGDDPSHATRAKRRRDTSIMSRVKWMNEKFLEEHVVLDFAVDMRIHVIGVRSIETLLQGMDLPCRSRLFLSEEIKEIFW